jgi:PTH1 family peptidyl-tRNA hydrolase
MLQRLRRNREQEAPNAAHGPVAMIVGLGNPGRRYQATRHNAGFMVVDRIHDLLPPGSVRARFQADFFETQDGNQRVVLVKPQTFMNESGIAVGQLARWYKVPASRILVVYDDLDLPFGTLRIRAGGSAGGHNGVASTIAHLRSQDFPRLRVGIGRPRSGSTVPYVLSAFSAVEKRELPGVLDRAAEAALTWLREGVTVAMNVHNRRPGSAASTERSGEGAETLDQGSI